MMARMMVRFPRAPTEFPMILMRVFKVGQDLASLRTRSCGETETVSGPGGCSHHLSSQVLARHQGPRKSTRQLIPLRWGAPRKVPLDTFLPMSRVTQQYYRSSVVPTYSRCFTDSGKVRGLIMGVGVGVVLSYILYSVAAGLLMWGYSMGVEYSLMGLTNK